MATPYIPPGDAPTFPRFRACDCPMYRRCTCDPPSIILDPKGQGASMAAMVIDAAPEALEDARRWVDFLAGGQGDAPAPILDAPPLAPDSLLLHDPGIW